MAFLQGPRFAARAGFTLVVAFFLTVFVFSLLLPSDSTVKSLIRFHWHRTSGYFSTPLNEQKWIFDADQYPVNFHNDVGLLIKTGYGTQDRVLPQMEAMGLDGTRNAVVVVGNFNGTLEENGIKVEVVDVIGKLLEEPGIGAVKDSPRALRYYEMHEAITAGNEEKAKSISREHGWDLDVLKFIPGLELAFNQAPYRKWWIIIDDDTFLVRSSLVHILAHLDPAQDQYIGNAVGDFRGRFAHGGSAIAISQRTMQHLFETPHTVDEAKELSFEETWGDKLIATTLMKLGIYLDERFAPFFTGEPPKITKINADNFCLPIASFHGIREPNNMRRLGEVIKEKENSIVFRGEIWPMWRQPDVRYFAGNPVREGHDHVGELGPRTTTIEEVATAIDCVRHCDKAWSNCLAWTWEERTFKCHLAPWAIIGDQVQGKFSGMHYSRAMDIGARCEETMRLNHWKNH